MLQENHYASKDIKSQKEFLDRGCRSFALRMNRRRDIILTSLKFHKSAGEVRGEFGFTSHSVVSFTRYIFVLVVLQKTEKLNFVFKGSRLLCRLLITGVWNSNVSTLPCFSF